MKKHLNKLISIFALLLLLSMCLASCSEWDVEPDGQIEVPDGQILLVKRGTAQFKIVCTSELGDEERNAIDGFVDRLRQIGINLDDPISDDSEQADIEFIFGTSANGRNNAAVTADYLGIDGYVNEVRTSIVNNKTTYSIVVAAATPELFASSINTLLAEGLGIDDNTNDMSGQNIFISTDFSKSKQGNSLDDTDSSRNDNKFEYPDDSGIAHPLSTIRVGNVDLSKYVIKASSDETSQEVVTYLRLKIFELSGIKLKTESELDESESSEYLFNIRISTTYSGAGFSVTSSGKTLIMSCAKPIRYMKAVEQFVNDKLVNTTSTSVNIGGKYEWDISYKYSEFGATNNGEADDDFPALLQTHEMANMYGINVIADKGFTYYIGETSIGREIPIQTNVDFGNATFLIDDTYINPFVWGDRRINVFNVVPDDKNKSYFVPTSQFVAWGLVVDHVNTDGDSVYKRSDGSLFLKKGQTYIKEFADLGISAMLRIHTGDDSERVYIRYGGNANSGSYKEEIILIDSSGNVNSSTPILYDYGSITEIEVYSIGDTALTVNGGTFITRANQIHSLNGAVLYNPESGKQYLDGNQYYYHERGLRVSRSNTTVKNLVHTIEEGSEKEGGYPYYGWLNVYYSNNVLFDSIQLVAHTTYTEDRTGGGGTQMGTYDIIAYLSNAITWKNCIQTNSITSPTTWGIMATNFVKNLCLDGCSLSRFDAHEGANNITIKDTTIGADINIVGAGLLTLDNVTKRKGDCFIKMRSDYGSTWEGDVVITNCTLEGYKPGNDEDITSETLKYQTYGAIDTRWVSHDFGYPCYLPINVSITNFTYPEQGHNSAGTLVNAKCYIFYVKRFNNTKDSSDNYIFSLFDSSAFTDSVNPYHPTEKIVFNNTQKMILSNVKGLFKNLESSGKLVIQINSGTLDKNHGT